MKRILLLLLVLLSCAGYPAKSQDTNENDKVLRKAVFEKADYIFEGTVLETKKYLTPENHFMSSALVQIHKVFRGNLTPGTIEIIGHATGQYEDAATGEIHEVSVSHGGDNYNFEKGTTSLFTVIKGEKARNIKLKPQYSAINTPVVFLMANIRYFLNGKISPGPITTISGDQPLQEKLFNTTQEIYDFVLKTPNTSFRDFDNKKFEKKYPVVPKPSIEPSVPADTAAIRENYERHQQYLKLKHENYEKRKKGPSANQRTNGNNQVTYTFRNAQLTGIGTAAAYLEYDVYIAAQSLAYLDIAAVHISYNSAVFGNNVVANNNVTVTRGAVISSTTNYESPAPADDQTLNNVFAVSVNPNLNLSNPVRGLVSSTGVQLFHIKMKIQNCNNATMLQFTNLSSMEFASWYTTTANAPLLDGEMYTSLIANSQENHTACKPQVTGYSTTSVAAGTNVINGSSSDNSKLIINGRFFGNQRGTGFIQLKNADAPSSSNPALTLVQIPATDILNWSDSQIEIRVATNIVDGAGNNDPKTPGTGPVRITNSVNSQNDISTTPTATIKWALLQWSALNSSGIRPRMKLYNTNSQGGYTINVDEAVANTQGALQCIKAALKDWSCQTGVNWKIGQITNNATYSESDLINTIYFENKSSRILSGTNISALTVPNRILCSSTGDKGFQQAFDIIINNTRSFLYNPDPIVFRPNGLYDFYAVIKHELGHGHLLGHEMDTDDIMYYSSSNSGTRKTNLEPNDIEAGTHLVNYSIGSSADCRTNKTRANTSACFAQSTGPLEIKSVSFSCLCAPGSSSPSVQPELQPYVTGGAAPYTYLWEALTGNTATLDNYGIEKPKITATTGNHRVYLKLTVLDNSDATLIATYTVDQTLTTSPTVNYAMRDSYGDKFDEPNSYPDIWMSPDVWNRNQNDNGTTPQDPEWKNLTANHVYARIRNVGCRSASSVGFSPKLRLYWTKASLGERWPYDWDASTATFMGYKAGEEITAGTNGIAIPDLVPGQETIIHSPWYPTNPKLWSPVTGEVMACFLARIEAVPNPPYNMTFPEIIDPPLGPGSNGVKMNVTRNNDIITRNMSLINWIPGIAAPGPRGVQVGNLFANVPMNIRFESIGVVPQNSYYDQGGSIILELGPEVYEHWISSGQEGSGISLMPETYSVFIENPEMAEIRNLYLPVGEQYEILVRFGLRDGVESYEPQSYNFRISQYLTEEGAENETGAVHFEVRMHPASSADDPEYAHSNDPIEGGEGLRTKAPSQNEVNVYPNPFTDDFTVQLYSQNEADIKIEVIDVLGKIIKTSVIKVTKGMLRHKLNMSNQAPGMYNIRIGNGEKVLIKKIIKI